MPTHRDVLSHLTRDELLAIVDRFSLSPPDRRAKEGLIETITASPQATFPAILATASRDRLKELCRALGLDDSGKEKAVILARLAGASSATPAAPAVPAKAPSAKAVSELRLM